MTRKYKIDCSNENSYRIAEMLLDNMSKEEKEISFFKTYLDGKYKIKKQIINCVPSNGN